MIEQIKQELIKCIERWAQENAEQHSFILDRKVRPTWLINDILFCPVELMMCFKINQSEISELNHIFLSLINSYIDNNEISIPYYFTYREPRIIEENNNYFVIVTNSIQPVS